MKHRNVNMFILTNEPLSVGDLCIALSSRAPACLFWCRIGVGSIFKALVHISLFYTELSFWKELRILYADWKASSGAGLLPQLDRAIPIQCLHIKEAGINIMAMFFHFDRFIFFTPLI